MRIVVFYRAGIGELRKMWKLLRTRPTKVVSSSIFFGFNSLYWKAWPQSLMLLRGSEVANWSSPEKLTSCLTYQTWKILINAEKTAQTSCLGPNFMYWGESAATSAGSHSFIAACKSFKCPHLGSLSRPSWER